jgi:hypothetical protein
LVESKKVLKLRDNSISQNTLSADKSKDHHKRDNLKTSIIYAILFDCLLIFGCISFICLFYVIGGILLNPLLIFGTLVIILLFALIETMNLVEKNVVINKKVGEISDEEYY